MKFHGDIAELVALVESTGTNGNWSEDATGKHEFRTKDRAILAWWPSSGTISIQGQREAKDKLTAKVEAALASDTPIPIAVPTPPKSSAIHQIFVVHGHDHDSRDQLELTLHRLGLQPYILMNDTGGGRTIIEALEGHIGRDYSSSFGIVLLTPDDVGYSKADGDAKAEPRARQNVILETGMLLSSLTRKRIALLVKGHLEIPSDLQGIIHLHFNDHVREVVPKLCAHFREAGIDLDPGKISHASA